MNITEFLDARIAEDEAAAREVDDFNARHFGTTEARLHSPLEAEDPGHDNPQFVSIDSTRVLAECAAKQRIVDLHSAVKDELWLSGKDHEYLWCESCGNLDDAPEPYPCGTVKALAAVYKDHPDYDPEWA